MRKKEEKCVQWREKRGGVHRGERREEVGGSQQHEKIKRLEGRWREGGGERAVTQQESLSALLHQRLLIKISLAEAGCQR